MLPEPVDHDTASQRVLRISDPVRKAQPAPSLGRLRLQFKVRPWEARQSAGCDDLALLLDVAAEQHRRRFGGLRVRGVAKRHGTKAVVLAAQLSQLAAQRIPASPILNRERLTDFRRRQQVGAVAEGRLDLFGGQGTVVQPRLLDLAGEEAIAGAGVAQTEQYLRGARAVRASVRAVARWLIGAEIKPAVAVDRD